MCGIHLIWDRKGNYDDCIIENMLQSTTYRGPDHAAFRSYTFNNQKLFLAANRLRVSEVSSLADQPYSSNCGNYSLIFNGEIYNFFDLRNELLQKGHSFNSISDTEVLLKLLIEEGRKAIPRLNGMFAFAFWDHQKNELLLARDRHGMKPLFYFQKENTFIAASETKGLLASGLIQKELNKNAVHHYLQFKYAPKPETFYKNIFQVEEGHFLLIKDGKIAQKKAFIPNKQGLPKIPEDKKGVIKKAEDLITDALFSQIESQKPVGLFLSGGVDSTLLLALNNKHGGAPLPCFSIVHDSKEGSFGTKDQHFARQAAKKYQAASYEEIIVKEDILKNLPSIIGQMDQPIGDSASLMTYLLSEKASKTMGVVLSGAGADELFAGYNRHYAFYQYLNYFGKLKNFYPLIKQVSGSLPTGINSPFRKKFRLWKKMGRSLSPSPEQTFLNFSSFEEFTKSISLKSFKKFSEEKFIEKHFRQALEFDRSNYLTGDILSLNDQMSMLHSLEMRMPYLNNEILNFTHQLPSTYLINGGKKWLLKNILNQMDGLVFSQRPKEGLGLPFGNWLKKQGNHYLWDFLQNDQAIIFEFISREKIKSFLKEHQSNKTDHSLLLWSILTLSIWLEKHF
ncbi:asparagine synthase (glutamine-hydrolyzing) [Xanthovirga aplysinae]|uniref:asparagine synthase (glutamine-hydrolyzing) n=1 Tax=Xanthovirga aplysinae TaxID=2529853 RepID=UPI0012BBCE8D|nr:asparagine synthase (glutamine-hydrolyzing) [Xanthovirga aplysinae]MTI30593.1 asparagine synthase (glutamine-hydrolyzing) [Xanthovirga aplysinae]